MVVIHQPILSVLDYNNFLLILLHSDRKEWSVQCKIVKWVDDTMMIGKVDLFAEVDNALQDGQKKYHLLVILLQIVVSTMINLMIATLLMIIGHH